MCFKGVYIIETLLFVNSKEFGVQIASSNIIIKKSETSSHIDTHTQNNDNNIIKHEMKIKEMIVY